MGIRDRSETMRLSLQLIASCFASVQAFDGVGFVWYNEKAKPTACNVNEGSMVNAAIENAFATAEGNGADTTSWTGLVDTSVAADDLAL